jgi:hypothetical protein
MDRSPEFWIAAQVKEFFTRGWSESQSSVT